MLGSPTKAAGLDDLREGFELVQFDAAHDEPCGNLRRVIDDWLRAQNVTLKAFMELGNIEAIKGLVANGLGCGLLPRMAVPGIAGRVLAVRSLSPRLHRRLAMILRRDKVPDRALSEVTALLAGIGAPTR